LRGFFAQFFVRLFCFKKSMLFVVNGAQIWQITSPLMWYNYVGEMEWQNFCRTLCAGDFLLGEKGLVKSTPGGATKQ
jgi:hypothetical protein